MDTNPKASTNEDQVSSTINIAPKYSKDTTTTNQQLPEDMSVTECACESNIVPSDNPEAEAHVEEEVWTIQDDEDLDRELNSKESDIRKFMEDYKDFHALMIQLNESQYYGRRMDTTYASIETDLQDLLAELAYRRAEEAEELRQKAELDELLKSIKDVEAGDEENINRYEDVMDNSQSVAMEVLDDLLNMVIESNHTNNDENINK